MSDRTAELMGRGAERYDSAVEAWESIKELRDKVDWNPENMPDIAELIDDD